MPLAVRERARVDHRLALGRDLDAAVLLLDEAVRDLDVGAQPDPELAGVARLAQAPLLLAQRAVIGRLEDEVERAPVVADVVRRAGHRLVRERVGGDEVLAPHLGRVDADLGRELVQRPLDRLRRLRPAGAAERRRGRRVRDHRAALELDPRDRVDAARHELRQVRQE